MLLLYIVKWPEQIEKNALVGSRVSFSNDGQIIYENRNLIPGTVIQKWNFGIADALPKLPILNQGSVYKVVANIQTEPMNTAHLVISFYDKDSSLIDMKVIQVNNETEIFVPESTCSYNLELVHSGFHLLQFDKIVFSDKNYGGEWYSQTWISDILGADFSRGEPIVIFTEPTVSSPNSWFQEGYCVQNVIIVSSDTIEQYCSQAIRDHILSKLQPFKNKKIRLVGYGPISNIVALYYSEFIAHSELHITSEFYDSRVYHRYLKKEMVEQLLNKYQMPSDDVTIYCFLDPKFPKVELRLFLRRKNYLNRMLERIFKKREGESYGN